MIQFGLRLHDAEKLPMEQLLPLIRQKGFTCVHLALSKALKEYPCTPGALTPSLFNDDSLFRTVLTSRCWATI